MSLADYATSTAPGIPKIRVVPGATQYAWAEDYNRLADGISLLADELNQLCMAIEEHASRTMTSARTRLSDKEVERERLLFNAARRMREKIVELIPE